MGRAPRAANPSVQNGEPSRFRACVPLRDEIGIPTLALDFPSSQGGLVREQSPVNHALSAHLSS